MNILKRIGIALLSASFISSTYADMKDLPKASSFQFDKNLKEELKIEVFAKSPMIYSPVAMDVDTKGRVWVTEDLAGLNKKVRGRITILEDSDNDGKADKAHEFGPTFKSIPMGIAVFDNVIVVSMAPELIVYTDVNRNARFEEGIDKKEILIKGFHGQQHDHSLHAVVGAPNGQWFFNHGNIGADIKTPDGKEFHFSSYYSHNPKSIGKKSSDGHLYVGGFGMSINPDGTNAEVIYENTRNTHDMFVTSFGDVLHSDNDDPAHARASWAMKYSRFGYASLENGSRSWEEAGKSWEEGKQYERHGKRYNLGHWRQNYPGTTPPGTVWGAGAPTGNVFIEGDQLGLRGTYIVCETVNKALFSFQPKLKDSQIDMGPNSNFLSIKEGVKTGFLPTDAILGLDGSMYMSDWNSYNNRRGKGNNEGSIYRISRKNESTVSLPSIDFNSKEGLIAALKSPAVNIRWVAVDRLKKMDGVYSNLIKFYETTDNPYHKARALWILPQLKDDKGVHFVEKLLEKGNEQERLTALRALVFAKPQNKLKYLKRTATDSSPSVRRETSLFFRDLSYSEIKESLGKIIEKYDGNNRWYLEAIGTASCKKETKVYDQLVKPNLPKKFSEWQDKHKNLAWRLRSNSALEDLKNVIISQVPKVDEFRKLMMTFSLVYSPEEQEQNLRRVKEIQEEKSFAGEEYQATIFEVLDKDIVDKPAKLMDASYVFPKQFGAETKISSSKVIAALSGNVENGKAKSAICMTCHKIDGTGIQFGPDLSNWAQTRETEVVIENIINPNAEIAHGFDKAVVVANKNYRIEGIETGYSFHAGAVKVKTVGGQTVKIAFRKSRAKIERLEKHSWMPPAKMMGLNDQDVRDIVAYLKSL
ncbi:MAG: c-type cytochrome [Lentisphaeraceae bacterium]|nr:c-type cytochrome [Lentisphaeraceae bacterium]